MVGVLRLPHHHWGVLFSIVSMKSLILIQGILHYQYTLIDSYRVAISSDLL
jgi:hypothetical protein